MKKTYGVWMSRLDEEVEVRIEALKCSIRKKNEGLSLADITSLSLLVMSDTFPW